tara:strand:- start:285 stop:845 length:561 start_codon:yes stop_codon:yes gene_type:complete
MTIKIVDVKDYDPKEIRRKRNLKTQSSRLDKADKKLRDKYRDRGTTGAAEFRKERKALGEKFDKKFFQDQMLDTKYGKDAMKSQAYGTSPIAPERKKKPKKKQVGGIMNREGMAVSREAKRKPKAITPGMLKPKFAGRRSKELRKKDVKGKVLGVRKAPSKDKKTAMRGGGLARSGAASLSGYKVR